MIELNLPEPDKKECGRCYRTGEKAKLVGRLIHWPDETWGDKLIQLGGNLTIEPHSFWYYACRWCRASDTRRKKESQHDGPNGNRDMRPQGVASEQVGSNPGQEEDESLGAGAASV